MTSTWTRDIIILLLLCTLFFGFMLGSRVLNTPDEGRYGEIGREMAINDDYVTPTLNGIAYLDKPPLLYWLQAPAIKIFGVSEWTLRLPSALLALFGCMIVYVASRRLYDRRTGWLATLILGTSPLYFGAAHYVNMDLAVSVLISAALLLFLVGTNIQKTHKQRNVMWLAYVFAALATLTKGLIGIVFPIMIIGAWIILCNEWRILKRMHIFSGLLIYAVITVPWFVMVQMANPQFFHYFFVFEQFERFTNTGYNNARPFWFYLPVLLAGFFPSSLLLFSTIRHHLLSKIKRKESMFLLLWLGLIFLFFSIPQSKLIGYILPIFPPAAILTAVYLSKAWSECTNKNNLWPGLRFAYWAAFFVAACGLVSLPIVFHYVAIPGLLRNYAYVLCTISFVAASTALWQLYSRGLKNAFAFATSGLAVFLMVLMIASPHLVRGSTKPLVQTIKPMLNASDMIIAYYDYPEDLGVYLQGPFSIVEDWRPEASEGDNWKQHFFYASQFEGKKTWMLDEKSLWDLWNKKRRIYLFVERNTFPALKKRITRPIYRVTADKERMVVTNHPLDTAQHANH